MQDERFFQENQVENHLATIFEELPGFIYFVKNRALEYVAYNQRLVEIFDARDASEILGKRDEDYLPVPILEHIQEDDRKILETGQSIVNQVELVPRGNGFVDWSTTTKKPLFNQKGEICGIIGVTRPFEQGTTSLRQNEELGPALDLLHKHFRENIAISALAKAANLSLSSFLRKFKACFNMTPKEYLRHLRVQEACHIIVRTTQSFAQISHHCGFADQSHFSREFSRIMREPPSAYRARYLRLLRFASNLPAPSREHDCLLTLPLLKSPGMNAVEMGLTERAEDLLAAPEALIEKTERAIADYSSCFWFRHPEAQVNTLDDVRIAILHLREYGGWKEWAAAQDLQKCLSPLSKKKS